MMDFARLLLLCFYSFSSSLQDRRNRIYNEVALFPTIYEDISDRIQDADMISALSLLYAYKWFCLFDA